MALRLRCPVVWAAWVAWTSKSALFITNREGRGESSGLFCWAGISCDTDVVLLWTCKRSMVYVRASARAYSPSFAAHSCIGRKIVLPRSEAGVEGLRIANVDERVARAGVLER